MKKLPLLPKPLDLVMICQEEKKQKKEKPPKNLCPILVVNLIWMVLELDGANRMEIINLNNQLDGEQLMEINNLINLVDGELTTVLLNSKMEDGAETTMLLSSKKMDLVEITVLLNSKKEAGEVNLKSRKKCMTTVDGD